MAQRKRTTDEEQGEQLTLIELEPANAKAIRRVARAYQEAQVERLGWLDKEKKQKDKILALVEEADLQPLDGDVIRFAVGDLTITITPRDKLVQVKPKKEAATEGEPDKEE